tara:strand:- start:53 stop:208 length:156 start_codon:yes stop_codon:yes gene_type:complete
MAAIFSRIKAHGKILNMLMPSQGTREVPRWQTLIQKNRIGGFTRLLNVLFT